MPRDSKLDPRPGLRVEEHMGQPIFRNSSFAILALLFATQQVYAEIDRRKTTPATTVVCGWGRVEFMASGNARQYGFSDNHLYHNIVSQGDLVVRLQNMPLAASEHVADEQGEIDLPSDFAVYSTDGRNGDRVINLKLGDLQHDFIFERQVAVLFQAMLTGESVRITSGGASGPRRCSALASTFQINTCGLDNNCFGTTPQ
jgi:hypothetical protein